MRVMATQVHKAGELEPMPTTRIPTPKTTMNTEIALAIVLSIARSADCRHRTLSRQKRSYCVVGLER